MVSTAALVSVVCLLLIGSANAQFRPFYASNGFTYPRPFIGGGGESSNKDGGIGNRFGGDNNDNRFGGGAPTKNGLGYDSDIVEAANNYPDEHKPFWLLNQEAIMAHLGLKPQSGRGRSRPSQSNQA